MQPQGNYAVDMPVESALPGNPVKVVVDESVRIIKGQYVQYKIVQPLLGGTQCGCYLVETANSTAQDELFVAKVKSPTV